MSRKKVKYTIGTVLLIVILSLMFERPIVYSILTCNTIDVNVKCDFVNVPLVYGEENNHTGSQDVQYVYFGKSILLKLPNDDESIVIGNDGEYDDCLLQSCYLYQDYYYIILSKARFYHFPLNSRTHEYDALLSINSKSGEIKQLYKSDPKEWLLFGDAKKIVYFNINGLSTEQIMLNSGERTTLFTHKKDDIEEVNFVVEKDNIAVTFIDDEDCSENAEIQIG